MRRVVFAIPLAALAVFPFLGCGTKADTDRWPGHKTGPKVAVSFAPLYCIAANVIGDKGTVKCALSTRGPHDADLGTDERALLESADLVVLNGIGLDDKFAEPLEKAGRGKKVAKLGDSIKETELRHPEEDDEPVPAPKDGKKPVRPGHEGHNHGDHDPHVWLSPTLAIDLVKALQVALRKSHPEYIDEYDRNAAAYIGKLKKLTDDGKALLKGKTEKKFATMHESLGYFADEFGLEIVGFLNKAPGAEPKSDELKRLVAKCVKSKARLIAVEPQCSAEGAKTVRDMMAREGIAEPALVEIDPIETATAAELTPDFYEKKMRANLDALAKTLK